MSQFGAPVLSTVPSAGTRQVRNLSINDRSQAVMIKAHQKVQFHSCDRHLLKCLYRYTQTFVYSLYVMYG